MKPYVQVAIDEVNTVVLDAENHFNADQFDRFATFEAARDEALCCLEEMIDNGDYDDEEHRREVVWMQGLLGAAGTIVDLQRDTDYLRFVARLAPVAGAA